MLWTSLRDTDRDGPDPDGRLDGSGRGGVMNKPMAARQALSAVSDSD